MRRAARVDANQGEIVDALRKVGVLVQSLAAVGEGVGDLLCGYRGKLCLLEIKDGDKPPSKRQLTAAQERWHEKWNEYVRVVWSVDGAIEVVTGKYTGGGGKVVR